MGSQIDSENESDSEQKLRSDRGTGRRVGRHLVLFAERHGQKRGEPVLDLRPGPQRQYGQKGPGHWSLREARRRQNRQTQRLEGAQRRTGDQEAAGSGQLDKDKSETQ